MFAAAVAFGAGDVVGEVRSRLALGDFTGASAAIQSERRSHGVTPDVLEAMSWVARAELSRGRLDQAEKSAQETYDLCVAALKTRPLGRDANAPFPVALGATIEVQADAMALRGDRASAVAYLRGELKKYAASVIATRIQKNVNRWSMEGKPAPMLQGVALPPGKTVLLFFWAHWCPDCKAEAGILRQLKTEFAARGLVLIAPTQHYGYVANGEDAPPAVETRYIEQVRQQFYSGLIERSLVVNEQNFRVYGASTTPTLVLIDRKGVVRMYHPGAISYPELRARILAALS